MSRLSVILATAAALAVTPVLAAPVYITVPGGSYVYEGTTLSPSGPDVPIFPSPPIGAPFDPAGAAIASMQSVPWGAPNPPRLLGQRRPDPHPGPHR